MVIIILVPPVVKVVNMEVEVAVMVVIMVGMEIYVMVMVDESITGVIVVVAIVFK